MLFFEDQTFDDAEKPKASTEVPTDFDIVSPSVVHDGHEEHDDHKGDAQAENHNLDNSYDEPDEQTKPNYPDQFHWQNLNMGEVKRCLDLQRDILQASMCCLLKRESLNVSKRQWRLSTKRSS